MTGPPAKSLLAWFWRAILKKEAISVLFITLEWTGLANLNAALSESIVEIEPFQFGFLIFFGLVSSWIVFRKFGRCPGLALLIPLLGITLLTPLQASKSHLIILNAIVEVSQSDWAQVILLMRLLLSSYSTYFIEIANWISGIYLSAGSAPPAAIQALWGTVLGCLTLWVSWWQIRRANPIAALLPIGLIITVILSYSGGNPLFLSVFLAVFILQIGASNYIHQEQLWEKQGTDYSYEIRYDVGAFVIFSALFILGSAYLLSAIPVRGLTKIASELYTLTNQTITGIGSSLGLQKSAGLRDISAFSGTGLPRGHLIGGDPALSEQLTLEISLDRTPPPTFPIYWHALKFDVYTGYGWESSPASQVDSQPSTSITDVLTSSPGFIEADKPYYFLQTVTKVDQNNHLLFSLGEPVTSDAPVRLSVRQPGDLYGATLQPLKYRLISSVVFPDWTELINSPAEYPQWVIDRYLQLPEIIPDRVRSLGVELTAGLDTQFAKTQAIEAYLRSIPYSLDVPTPPAEREITDYFLFEVKTGYCDYYATAMVVLLRLVGVPSRLVMGYAQGEYDAEQSVYRVSEADAHSWVEIFFPQIGWVTFEPTPGLPAIVRSEQTALQDADITLPPSLPLLSKLTSLIQRLPAWVMFTTIFLALFVVITRLTGTSPTTLQFFLHPNSRVGIVYHWLFRTGQQLEIHLPVSTTPNELAQSLLLRSQEQLSLIAGKYQQKFARRIWVIVSAYNQETYSAHSHEIGLANSTVQAWLSLQPIFWFLWLLLRLKMLQSTFRKIFITISGSNN